MLLQLLIPQYNEDDAIIKNLLDSIEIQQNIDFNQVGVIIVNDGSKVILSKELLNKYSFAIEYYQTKHLGVSNARNEALKHASAEYIMFCDADDMFYNICGLYIIFREIALGQFDGLVSNFIEETRLPTDNCIAYVEHPYDSTFVHGKVYRRNFLLKNNIWWNSKLTIHEDSYFNCLCQECSKNFKYCENPFYLWKWRENSVCRSDKQYILKTFVNMLESNASLIEELIKREKIDRAQYYCLSMVYNTYFDMNKEEWLDKSNIEYLTMTETHFSKYWQKYQTLFEEAPRELHQEAIIAIKTRALQEGILLEKFTFEDWLKKIQNLKEEGIC